MRRWNVCWLQQISQSRQMRYTLRAQDLHKMSWVWTNCQQPTEIEHVAIGSRYLIVAKETLPFHCYRKWSQFLHRIMKEFTVDHKPSSATDGNGRLLIDDNEQLKKWTEHFRTILNRITSSDFSRPADDCASYCNMQQCTLLLQTEIKSSPPLMHSNEVKRTFSLGEFLLLIIALIRNSRWEEEGLRRRKGAPVLITTVGAWIGSVPLSGLMSF